MRQIRKGPEPKSWSNYWMSTEGANYEGAPKDDLREALIAEQGDICCYCMGKIDENTTRIEHRKPRSKYPDHQFAYRNLLAACQGGEGLEPARQHCDVAKGNQEITLDPTNPSRSVEEIIHYSSSGTIGSTDEAIHRDLDVTLNLNLDWLKDARQEVLDGFREGFQKKHKGTWPPKVMDRELKKWAEIPPAGKLQPYCGIVVHYLRKRLRRSGKSASR